MSGSYADNSPQSSPYFGSENQMTDRILDQGDLWYFNEGTERHAYRILGSQHVDDGIRFSVWAPNARELVAIGDFNGWNEGDRTARLSHVGTSGVWSGWVPSASSGDRYKFHMIDVYGRSSQRADPFASMSEIPPATASVISSLDFEWNDREWMDSRGLNSALRSPVSIYEVHLGSWGRTVASEGRFPTYREIGVALTEHLSAHGFTHVELMPVMGHPFYGSWGYQTTSYFAPSALYGTPADLMDLVDTLHCAGIAVILDWVPSHFPTDDFALANFDGTSLYEYADAREGFHQDWNSAIFNYSRHEVRSFLISSAMSWLDRYHIDGLRVDAVASMLYRDYSRKPGQWIPNVHGGRENLEAISFLQQLNVAVAEEFPGVATFAEESTAFPGVTGDVEGGGLGFTYKWDMGWMHDTLRYFRNDPIHRRWHQDDLTFRSVYAFTEHFTLPLSHDEVVHAKGSLLEQMSGDTWQQFANLRVLYGCQWTQPGKKLLFMGSELAPRGDWAHESVLDWTLHDLRPNAGVRSWITHLNHLYRSEPALHEGDCDPNGFEWIDNSDSTNSVVAYLRKSIAGDLDGCEADSTRSRPVLVVVNATPIPRSSYRLGVPKVGGWRVLGNSDAAEYGGSGWLEAQLAGTSRFDSVPVPYHRREQSIEVELPPLSILILGFEL